MQSLKQLFRSQLTTNKYEDNTPLLNTNSEEEDLKSFLKYLTYDDLLNRYVSISNIGYDEEDDYDIMYQIRKLKGRCNMRIPKGTLIIFTYCYDDADRGPIEGAKDDDCECYDGVWIGMINDKIDMMQNIVMDMNLQLYQKDGSVEYRHLYASYLKCDTQETHKNPDLYEDWRFWLLSTGEKEGFYTDFTKNDTYIIFPTHALYDSIKAYYEM